MCCVNAHLLYRGPDIRDVMKDHKMGLFWPSQYCGCMLVSLPFPWLDSKQSYNILSATQSKGERYMAITYTDNLEVPRISLRAATLLCMHTYSCRWPHHRKLTVLMFSRKGGRWRLLGSSLENCFNWLSSFVKIWNRYYWAKPQMQSENY